MKQYEAEGRPHVVRFAMPVKEYRFDDAVLGPNQGVAANRCRTSSSARATACRRIISPSSSTMRRWASRTSCAARSICSTRQPHRAAGGAGLPPADLRASAGDPDPEDRREALASATAIKKIRQRTHEWMKSSKKTCRPIWHGAAAWRRSVLDEWLKNDKKQLDLSEQPTVMKVVGLKEADLPEIMVHDFRKNGYLPEVLNNFLALLGWSPGGDKERMSMDEMVKLFSLDGIGKSNAKFNRDKLVSTPKPALPRRPRVCLGIQGFPRRQPDSPLNTATDEQLSQLL